jgi:hypothetical protein
LGPEAREDLRYVIFYKDAGGKMRAKLTRDVQGQDVEKELGLISWAPDTVGEATRNYKAHKGFGAKYFLDDVATLSNKKKIYHFMPLNGNFALHSAYLGGVPRAGQRPSLQANGYKDPSGHGCIRISNATSTTGGHEFLFARAKELRAKYGLSNIPIVVDYLPFVDPRALKGEIISNEEVPKDAGLQQADVTFVGGEVTDPPASEEVEGVESVPTPDEPSSEN